MHVSRYNLEYYLPLFLWAADCSRKNVHPFWELLEIISKADSSTLFGLDTDTETEVTLQILSGKCTPSDLTHNIYWSMPKILLVTSAGGSTKILLMTSAGGSTNIPLTTSAGGSTKILLLTADPTGQ